jgi:hypothetical protein
VNKATQQWWRQFFGLGTEGTRRAVEILSDLYTDARRDAARLQKEARRMQYPQFRDTLSAMAAQRAGHDDTLAEKISS